MLRKLILVALVAAATAVGLWRLGVLETGGLKDEAAELRDRAEKNAKRAAEEAAERAGEAIGEKRP